MREREGPAVSGAAVADNSLKPAWGSAGGSDVQAERRRMEPGVCNLEETVRNGNS